MLLIPGQLFFRNFAAGTLRRIDTDLFQREQIRAGVHHTACDENGRHVDSADSHQVCRHCFVAAGDEYAAVKRSRSGVDLNHVCNRVAAGKRIIDAVVSLCHAVTDIGSKIPSRFAAGLSDT